MARIKPSEEHKELWKEAIKRYPVGTKFKVVHAPEIIITVTSHRKDKDSFVYGLYNKLHVNLNGTGGDAKGGSVYYNGKWAEVVEYPPARLEDILGELDQKIKAMEKRLGGKS